MSVRADGQGCAVTRAYSAGFPEFAVISTSIVGIMTRSLSERPSRGRPSTTSSTAPSPADTPRTAQTHEADGTAGQSRGRPKSLHRRVRSLHAWPGL